MIQLSWDRERLMSVYNSTITSCALCTQCTQHTLAMNVLLFIAPNASE